MNARVFDKSKLPSRHVTEGAARAPHRSYLYAMGLTEGRISQLHGQAMSRLRVALPELRSNGDLFD